VEASLSFTVTDDDTAVAVGSGSLPVLGTPRLLAWCEATTCAAIDPTLDAASTSVGTRVDLEHVGASAVGQEVKVTAWASYVDGRLHRFTVAARNVAADGTEGKLVGTGEITRVVVDRERFLSRL
jgi:fluoroacetyl-CoA thioesterase